MLNQLRRALPPILAFAFVPALAGCEAESFDDSEAELRFFEATAEATPCVLPEEPKCPEGTTCNDIIFDNCNPLDGDSKCPGVCLPGEELCNKNDPNRSYVSHDPNTCAFISWKCVGSVPFSDACGCGCEFTDSSPIGPFEF